MSKKLQFLVATLILLLYGIVVLPSFLPARTKPGASPCVNNLQQIDGATQQWALDKGKTTNDAPTWQDLEPYFRSDWKRLTCERGGTYTLGRLNQPLTCSYSGHSLQ